jgi:hypothetical protein
VASTGATAIVSPYLVRTYNTPIGEISAAPAGHAWTILEAALATISSPLYFDAFPIGDFRFQDAGPAGFTNPSQLTFEEARALFPGHRLRHFVSLGAGLPSPLELRNLSQMDRRDLYLEHLEKVANDTERVHYSISGELQKP